ncbi:unnamed protein product, partial [Iphiclides podalirius]
MSRRVAEHSAAIHQWCSEGRPCVGQLPKALSLTKTCLLVTVSCLIVIKYKIMLDNRLIYMLGRPPMPEGQGGSEWRGAARALQTEKPAAIRVRLGIIISRRYSSPGVGSWRRERDPIPNAHYEAVTRWPFLKAAVEVVRAGSAINWSCWAKAQLLRKPSIMSFGADDIGTYNFADVYYRGDTRVYYYETYVMINSTRATSEAGSERRRRRRRRRRKRRPVDVAPRRSPIADWRERRARRGRAESVPTPCALAPAKGRGGRVENATRDRTALFTSGTTALATTLSQLGALK